MLRRTVEILQLQDEINRIFSEVLSHLKVGASGEYTYDPCLDVVETADRIMVVLEAPGIVIRQVSVHLTGRWVIIEGEKPAPVAEGNPRFLCLERAHGKFYKAVPILVPFNSREGRAVLENGFLKVSFPKVPERRQRTITLKVEHP
jgi:HSP20 family protein